MLTVSLGDYAVPRGEFMPPLILDHTTTPSPLNPLGQGLVSRDQWMSAAIASAVMDALAPLGSRSWTCRLRPRGVWAAMHRAT